jgi:hypothetical protein
LATSFPDFFNSLAPSAETISLILMQVSLSLHFIHYLEPIRHVIGKMGYV